MKLKIGKYLRKFI